jgi:hypothetical protein
MAKRENAYQRFCDKVRVGKLAERLHQFALSKPGDEDYEDVKMSNAQVTAARTLLAKVVPDMRSVEVTGQGEWNGDPNSISNETLAQIILDARKDDRVLN